MTDFIWVLKDIVPAVHDEQLAQHGGRSGLRDSGLLEFALARPRNLLAHEACEDVARLAAAYAYGLARSHSFTDGNKRTALVTAELFLDLNGYRLSASDAECVLTMLGLADGTFSEAELTAWFRENLAVS